MLAYFASLIQYIPSQFIVLFDKVMKSLAHDDEIFLREGIELGQLSKPFLQFILSRRILANDVCKWGLWWFWWW